MTDSPTHPPALTLGFMAQACGGDLRGGSPTRALEYIVTDSRHVVGPRSLFVALVGERFDGHDYLESVAQRGVEAALVERGRPTPEGLATIAVEDTLAALQAIAAAWRRALATPILAITGSNGKTIVKEMLASILATKRTLHRSPGSYNSQLGVALSLLELRPEHDLGLIEAGISEVGEMERLRAMIQPDFGVLTNIGTAHIAGLGPKPNIAREKSALFTEIDATSGWLVLPSAGEQYAPLRRLAQKLPTTYAEVCDHDDAPSVAEMVTVMGGVYDEETGWRFQARLPDGATHDFTLHAAGAHNLDNAAVALAAAWRLGVSPQVMRTGLAGFDVAPMRLEIHTTPEGVTLLNDAYNADPVSARAALSTLRQHAGTQRTIAILGDMLDLGELAEPAHLDLGAAVVEARVDRLISVGEWAEALASGARRAGMPAEHVYVARDLEQVHQRLRRMVRPRDVVLFKASRAIGLERAAARLLESVGPTQLRIDLGAIRQNYHALRQRLGGVPIMAVVKSFGYGNDATRVSFELVRQGVAALAVAYPDEAIPLRRAGIDVPILVNNTLAQEADKIVAYGLTALVYSREVARQLQREAQRTNQRVPIHLKIDTGMRRVGVRPGEVSEFLAWLAGCDRLTITGVMTHFAAADMASEDAFTHRQIEAFEWTLQAVKAHGVTDAVRHAANTSAAWRFPQARYDMVRVGLGLYGLHPSEDVAATARGTRPALAMTTRVIHLQDLEVGETVGYGRTWRAERPTRLATIAVGYNDGFARFMSNGGEVMIHGVRCPVAGNVCMDATMVDVTDIAAQVHVGDEVVLFGQRGEHELPIETLAARGGTISYEILCNISSRVRRIFVHDEDA